VTVYEVLLNALLSHFLFKHSREECICLTTLSIQDFVMLGCDATSFGNDTVPY